MLGQLQNAAGLDELMNSSKPVGGNFDRAGSNKKATTGKQPGDSSFSEMLLSTLNKAQSNKEPQRPEAPVQKTQSQSQNQANAQAKQAFAEKVANSERKTPTSKETAIREESRPSRDHYSFDRSDDSEFSLNEAPEKTSDKSFQAAASDKTTNAEQTASAPTKQPVIQQNQTAQSTPVASTPVAMTPEQLAAMALANGTVQQAPTEQIIAAATVSNPDAKAALAPLKGLMTGKPASDALINRNPVLAFVTGHLEKLDPESLPSLITDSALIKQAMSANDVAQFMQTPLSIGDLVSLLELDQSLVNKASQAGLDPNKLVTPKEFLQALGLDAGRIASELSILKQKLPSEGVASYVQRAKAMMSNAAKNVDQSTVSNAASKLNKDAAGDLSSSKKTAADAKDRVNSELSNPLLAGLATGTADPAINPQATNLAGLAQMAQANASSVRGQSGQKSIDLSASVPTFHQQTSTGVTPSSSRSSLGEIADPADILAAQAIYSGIKVASPTESMGKNEELFKTVQTESTEELPTFEAGSLETLSVDHLGKDPYSELGRIMDSSNVTKVDFGGDGISQRSLEEHLLSRGIQQAIQQKTDAVSQPNSFDLESTEEPLESITSEMISDFKLKFSQEALTTITPAKESSFSGFDFSEGEGFQDGGTNLREQTTEITTNLGKQSTELRQSGENFADKVTESPKAASKDSIASKILGQAQMMLKNGGGSMRVDVEAPGIGKVDVAINLINNQLDVRIITASEQARDMISKEVLGLRDGLTQQGINLRGLEVGKAGEASSRNFAGQGQQFGQGAQDQRSSYNDMREYAQSFRSSFAPRADRAKTQVAPSLSRWSNGSIPSSGNGRLEVRV